MRRTSSQGSFALSILRSRNLVFCLVGLGILLRAAQYLANRSLWVDEAWLALNLIDRPLSELTKPLAFNQAAPVGFLFVEGIVAKTVGVSEYALRLFPLVCGLVSIPAFAWLARHVLSAAAAPFAILLFVVADGPIYYSSEVKPYATDLAVAVCLLAAGMLVAENAERRTRTARVVAIAGLALVPLSFASVFVVAAVAAIISIRVLFDQHRQLTSPASLVIFLWGSAAIGVVVFGATRAQRVRASLGDTRGFLGVGGSSSPLHVVNVMGTQIAEGLGFLQERPFNHLDKLALLCVVIGGFTLLRRNPTQLLMLVVPFALLFAASAARFYPILKRTDLFLVPAVVLLIAEGIAQITRSAPERGRAATAVVLAVLVGAGPVWLASKRLVHPRTAEEIKPVLEFVRDHSRPGDTLYVDYAAQYALLYYHRCHCLRFSAAHDSCDLWPLRPLHAGTSQFAQAAVPVTHDVLLGQYFGTDTNRYVEDLDRVRGRRRVWFLYSHVSSAWHQSLIRDVLLRRMALLGERINGIDRPGAHAYLYQLDTS
jgi:uncharacterized membrane protein